MSGGAEADVHESRFFKDFGIVGDGRQPRRDGLLSIPDVPDATPRPLEETEIDEPGIAEGEPRKGSEA